MVSQPSLIENGLAEAATAIARARDLLSSGTMVDLAGLDSCVAKLCDAIADLPKDQCEDYKSRLVGLIDDLNSLVESLSAQHKELSSALKNVSSRHRATAAYGAPTLQGGAPQGGAPKAKK